MKKVFILFLSLFLMVGIVGCSDDKHVASNVNQPETTMSDKLKDVTSVDELYDLVKDEASDKETTFYQMIDADNGIQFKYGNISVEVYQFSNKKKLEEAKEILKSDESKLEVINDLLILTHSDETFSELLV